MQANAWRYCHKKLVASVTELKKRRTALESVIKGVKKSAGKNLETVNEDSRAHLDRIIRKKLKTQLKVILSDEKKYIMKKLLPIHQAFDRLMFIQAPTLTHNTLAVVIHRNGTNI